MKFDFTEGEWEYNWKEAEFKVFSKNKPICRIFKEFNEDGLIKAEANARLIACAPEMLELLLEIVNSCIISGEKSKKIKVLLEKATGKKWEDKK